MNKKITASHIELQLSCSSVTMQLTADARLWQTLALSELLSRLILMSNQCLPSPAFWSTWQGVWATLLKLLGIYCPHRTTSPLSASTHSSTWLPTYRREINIHDFEKTVSKYFKKIHSAGRLVDRLVGHLSLSSISFYFFPTFLSSLLFFLRFFSFQMKKVVQQFVYNCFAMRWPADLRSPGWHRVS